MLDGQIGRFENANQVAVGMIVREVHEDGTVPPFADSVVIKRVRHSMASYSFIICRPYAFVSSGNTSCPTPLFGSESMEMSFESLRDRYAYVAKSSGEPFAYRI
jgi:hypothetical protein